MAILTVSINGPSKVGEPVPSPISALVIALGSATVNVVDGSGFIWLLFKPKQGPIGPLSGVKTTGSEGMMSLEMSGKVDVSFIVTFGSPITASGVKATVGARVGFMVGEVLGEGETPGAVAIGAEEGELVIPIKGGSAHTTLVRVEPSGGTITVVETGG